MEKAYLVLNNGRVFEGTRIGAEGDGLGELVFTTGMTGYLETLTDPSYAGQIILQTFPLIGNYGVIPADFEGPCLARGYVVRELCETPSNFRSEYPLDRFLKEHKIPGICGVDTRALTRIIREEGVMNALICSEPPADLTAIKSYAVRDGVKTASCKAPQSFPAEGEEKFHVALLDYGAKHHIVESLQERGCRVTVLPHDTGAEAVLALRPDGLMLSNGPGDPKENSLEIQELQKLIGKAARLRHLPRPSACGPGPRRRDGEAQVRPPGGKPAGEGPQDRALLHHEPEPRLRGAGGERGRYRGASLCKRQ